MDWQQTLILSGYAVVTLVTFAGLVAATVGQLSALADLAGRTRQLAERADTLAAAVRAIADPPKASAANNSEGR